MKRVPAAKKTTAAKRAPAKKTTKPAQHWVLPILQDALDSGEFWTLSQLALAHTQHELAVTQGKAGLASRRAQTMKALAENHATRKVDAAYTKKRNALFAIEGQTAAKLLARDGELTKLRIAHERAQRKAIQAAGIPA